MLQHYQRQDHATEALDRVRHYKSTAATMHLPIYPPNRDHAKFYAFKQTMLAAFDSVELTEIISGRVLRDGPAPAAQANIHATNQMTFDMANQTAYNMLVRTFTAENHGHADAISIATGQGVDLYAHLVLLNEGLMATKIDDTQDLYNYSKQLPTETARQFIARTQILRTSLITANVVITERNLNKVIKRGILIDEHKRDILATYTTGTHIAFVQGLEEQLNLDDLPALTSNSAAYCIPCPSNKRTVASISTDEEPSPPVNPHAHITCYRCGIRGHFASNCSGKGGGKGGNKGGSKGQGRGRFFNFNQGRGNNFGQRGGDNNYMNQSMPQTDPNILRQALTTLVNQIQQAGPPATTPPITQAPPPSANDQAVDHLMANFFNCTITSQAYNARIVAAITKLRGIDGPNTVYWLFDTACGAHLSNNEIVFVPNAPRINTESMLTADGTPMAQHMQVTPAVVSVT